MGVRRGWSDYPGVFRWRRNAYVCVTLRDSLDMRAHFVVWTD
eukprot:COSAG05_NODE_6283_length_986_cov_1.151071_1_plen_41_part_10